MILRGEKSTATLLLAGGRVDLKAEFAEDKNSLDFCSPVAVKDLEADLTKGTDWKIFSEEMF